MVNKWIRIGKAARLLGVSTKTLLRAEGRGAIRFARNRRGWRFVRAFELNHANVLTLGHLTQKLNLPYKTLLKAAKRGKLRCRPLIRRYSRRKCYRRTSLAEGYRFKRWFNYFRRWSNYRRALRARITRLRRR